MNSYIEKVFYWDEKLDWDGDSIRTRLLYLDEKTKREIFSTMLDRCIEDKDWWSITNIEKLWLIASVLHNK